MNILPLASRGRLSRLYHYRSAAACVDGQLVGVGAIRAILEDA